MRETWVQSLGWEDILEKGKATHSSILAWRIPWTESERVGHNWTNFTFTSLSQKKKKQKHGLPRWCSGKEFTCCVGDARDAGSVPGSGRSPGGGHGNPLQYSCLENPHGQRSLVGYSPWGRKESDRTELLSTHAHGKQGVHLSGWCCPHSWWPVSSSRARSGKLRQNCILVKYSPRAVSTSSLPSE